MAKKKKEESIEKEQIEVVDEVTVDEVEVIEEKVEEVKEKPKRKGKIVSLTQKTATYEDGTVVSITRAQHKVLVNGGTI